VAHLLYQEGVQPLASSQSSSNTPDVMDILSAMTAFEQQNTIVLELRLSTAKKGTEDDFWITCLAHNGSAEIGDLPPLASVSMSFLALRVKSLDAALFRALYALDAQLALNEFASMTEKRA
jgi:hypothetical protein